MKGIILAGGTGSRLRPATTSVSKQLLPVYDKPMIYYPLSVLMLADVRDILLITTPADLPLFQRLLSDGSQLGLDLKYATQPEPKGIPEAFLIGADHIAGDTTALVLGDNIFHGHGFSELLRRSIEALRGCVLFGYPVDDPGRYGVGLTDDAGRLVSIEEKPVAPPSNRAVTGLYFYDSDVVEIARSLRPSARGETEITDVNRAYIARGTAELVDLGRGFAWLDTGTPDALMQASQYLQTLQQRQGVRIACLEEIALRMGFIDAESCYRMGLALSNAPYGRYVMDVAAEHGGGPHAEVR
uniref:Glucose-1-phosphate thymidylyltransferase n=1 Tax=Verrucosispora sp. TaxID=1871626 RepID=A0A894JSW8_9ACTN|nr:dTDP-glucose synthase [Verrucosispora sp.]